MQKSRGMWVQSLGWEDPLEEDMATHSSILAWRIPWTETPGRLQPISVTKSQTQLSEHSQPLKYTLILRIVIPSSQLMAKLFVCICKLLQSRPTLCDTMDCRLPGVSVHGILQARILEWIAIPFSRGSSQLTDQSLVSCIAGRFSTV